MQAHREGRLDDAIASYDEAVALGMESAKLQCNLAMAHHSRGQLGPAIICMRQAVALSPRDTTLHNNLGGMLLEHGELDAAAAAFTAALDIDPSHRSTLFNLGNLEHRRGRVEAAAQCFRRVIDHHGADAGAVNNLATALIELGDAQGAISLLETSSGEHPGPHSHNNLGLALRAVGRPEQAAAAYRRALSAAPDFAEAHNNLGNLLINEGDSATALIHLRRATELSPDAARFYSNLGTAQQSTGLFDEAKVSLQRAVELDPSFAIAKRHLTLIGGGRDLQLEINECNTLLDQTGLPESERAHLHFALGKLLDEVRDFDRAFEHYQRGNVLVRKSITYDSEAFTRRVDETIRCFDEVLLARNSVSGHPSPRPVFVVGMPRSGTSLVEQVLATHPQVTGAGELVFFADLEGRLAQLTGGGPYPGCVRTLDAKQTLGLAEKYLGVLDACDHESRYVIDKLPGNALRLGLIQLLLPNARVIYCTREARDVGLSNYFQYFTGRQDFAYDLYEIGVAIQAHERVTKHWRKRLTLPILEVAYEQMVDDLEPCIRSMLAFLELPFEPQCLEFHRTQRTVRTASSWQVRQPLYASSVGRWRDYAKHLTPLIEGLESGMSLGE